MSRAHQQGVALITALVLVALATVVAVSIGFNSEMSVRRTVATFSVEQGLQLGQGAEALAAYALREDKNADDSAVDAWNQHYGPVEVAPEVSLEAQVSDEQAKFNLNTLLLADGTPDPDAVLVFKRLLELLELEPQWASLLVDWLDTNVQPEADGGEDSLYLSQSPPNRTANLSITSVSELMQLPKFGRERYLKLLPHITALPPMARTINVCLADGYVLDALNAVSTRNPGNREYSLMTVDALTQARARGCFPRRNVLASGEPRIEKRVSEQSGFFRLQSWVRIGTTRFALYSLLYRDGSGQVRPIARTMGTE
jgi:general secretion pathway protein K